MYPEGKKNMYLSLYKRKVLKLEPAAGFLHACVALDPQDNDDTAGSQTRKAFCIVTRTYMLRHRRCFTKHGAYNAHMQQQA